MGLAGEGSVVSAKVVAPPPAVGESRVAAKVAMAEAPQPTVVEQTAAQAQEVTAAAEAVKQGIIDATQEWANAGMRGVESRGILEVIAAEAGVQSVQQNLDSLNDEHKAAKTPGGKEVIVKRHGKEVHILRAAQENVKRLRLKMEAVKENPNASIEERLLVYDMDLAQQMITLQEANKQVDLIQVEVDAATGEDLPAAQAKLDEAKKEQAAIISTRAALNKKRVGIGGTPEQQNINYVAGMVRSLMGTTPLTEEQTVQLIENPLGLLQGHIDTVGMAAILENSDFSLQEQKTLLATATAEDMRKAVRNKDALDAIGTGGQRGLLAILILLYTAYGSNKKAKGQHGG